MKTIVQILKETFKNEMFTVKQAYEVCPNVNKESVRARIYENLGVYFKRIARGIFISDNCLIIEGDGRDLSFLEDESLDCIITDHPWSDKKSNKGGNRNFASYDTFEYTLDDFKEKARVLKQGCFLVEMLPAENENNFEYLYKIKKMAQEVGFEYYAKVPWIKGNFVSNTGRKAKNSEDIMIFSKGKARALRLDVKKTKKIGHDCYMSGTNGMLPTSFSVQAVPRNEVIAQSQKPVELFEQLLSYITMENEIVLDQFAGSGAVGIACLKKNRNSIMIEKSKELCDKIKNRLNYQVCLDI